MSLIEHIQKLIFAMRYSYEGFCFAFMKERAFYVEVFVSLVLLPLLFVFQLSFELRVAVIGAHLIVMMVELLNTSVEKTIDMVQPNFHHLAKVAKDMGSAAVFLSLLNAILWWSCALYRVIF